MSLTEYQKNIILNNPSLSVSQLSKLAGCSESTVKNYRRSMRKGEFGPVAPSQKGGQESPNVPVRDNKDEGDKLPSSIYNPLQLAEDLSIMCRSELDMYKVAQEQIKKNGPDGKNTWNATQHFKNYVSGVVNLAKWFGMEKLTLISEAPKDLTKERLESMTNDEIEQYLKSCLE